MFDFDNEGPFSDIEYCDNDDLITFLRSRSTTLNTPRACQLFV